MPGNMFPSSSYSEPQKCKRQSHHKISRSPDLNLLVQKNIDFKEDEQQNSPPAFFKDNSLPFEVKNYLDSVKKDDDVVDGTKAAGDVKVSSQNSSSSKEDSDEKLWEVMSELKSFDRWADEQLQVRSPNTTKSDDSKVCFGNLHFLP